MLDFNNILDRFCEDLELCSCPLSEDTIRYYLFAKMIEADSMLSHYCLELPYESMTVQNDLGIRCNVDFLVAKNNMRLHDQELDMYYASDDEIVCLEVKFHRRSSSSAFPHPLSAGKLINDFQRLELIKRSDKEPRRLRRMVFYVTDSEMNDYLSKSKAGTFREGLAALYGGAEGNMVDIKLENAAKTMVEAAFDSLSEAAKTALGYPNIFLGEIKTIYKRDGLKCSSPSLKGEGERPCYVRLYEIQ